MNKGIKTYKHTNLISPFLHSDSSFQSLLVAVVAIEDMYMVSILAKIWAFIIN